MAEPRIIKKYPNRRLYDTTESRYITLEDVRRLVAEGKGFTVVEQRTGRNITRLVLLQVISELEQESARILSEPMLMMLVQSYNNPDNIQLVTELETTLRRSRNAPQA
ncbi:MAG TPA: polyhydroxyalkanoate synthesis regulator DNA-binding domain-containing protein [Burkholderiales bacterium]|nr:polyhydroxyalkanoate synthesis regulator DNA-binding domain-containing protein [Burkholderiales bacterium]